MIDRRRRRRALPVAPSSTPGWRRARAAARSASAALSVALAARRRGLWSSTSASPAGQRRCLGRSRQIGGNPSKQATERSFGPFELCLCIDALRLGIGDAALRRQAVGGGARPAAHTFRDLVGKPAQNAQVFLGDGEQAAAGEQAFVDLDRLERDARSGLDLAGVAFEDAGLGGGLVGAGGTGVIDQLRDAHEGPDALFGAAVENLPLGAGPDVRSGRNAPSAARLVARAARMSAVLRVIAGSAMTARAICRPKAPRATSSGTRSAPIPAVPRSRLAASGARSGCSVQAVITRQSAIMRGRFPAAVIVRPCRDPAHRKARRESPRDWHRRARAAFCAV